MRWNIGLSSGERWWLYVPVALDRAPCFVVCHHISKIDVDEILFVLHKTRGNDFHKN